MEKKGFLGDNELEKIGLVRVFSNMDTQTAIVAAFVISLGTVLADALADLCTYVYWSAYFNRFRIPLEYLEEAIISETGWKYVLVLCIPMVIFIWWFLNQITNRLLRIFSRLINNPREKKLLDDKKLYIKFIKLFSIFMLYVVLFVFWMSLATELDLNYMEHGYILTMLFGEVALFIFYTVSKSYFGKNFAFSKRKYYIARIIVGVFLTYFILGGVYYAGSFGNNGSFRGGQVVKLANITNDMVWKLEDDEKINVQMVLLETSDYYYVTDAELKSLSGELYLNVWDDDTYRFIDKVDCPIKNQYVNLWNMNTNYNEDFDDTIFLVYLFSLIVFIYIFVCVTSIPMKKEEYRNE